MAIWYYGHSMAVKMTFTLDDETVARINRNAARLSKPKSEIVRDAIRDFDARSDRLSESERLRMIRVLEKIMAQPPTRTQREVDREIAEIRRARRSGGRLHPVE
jgi:metal-responsive CopG/Arc/MetJ family transcriptional regulator